MRNALIVSLLPMILACNDATGPSDKPALAVTRYDYTQSGVISKFGCSTQETVVGTEHWTGSIVGPIDNGLVKFDVTFSGVGQTTGYAYTGFIKFSYHTGNTGNFNYRLVYELDTDVVGESWRWEYDAKRVDDVGLSTTTCR
jgi:hypothetical protein